MIIIYKVNGEYFLLIEKSETKVFVAFVYECYFKFRI